MALERISLSAVITLLKAALIGLVAAEISVAARFVAHPITREIDAADWQGTAVLLSAFCFALVLLYCYARGLLNDTIKLLRSTRVDMLVMFMAGGSVSLAFGGIGTAQYQTIEQHLTGIQLLVITSLPILTALLLAARTVPERWHKHGNTERPFFISDVELTSAESDLLNISESAERFAERLLNGGARDSIVFGIDAPWGIGKSTFVNFCIEYFTRNHSNSTIVFKFDLLRYSDRSKLLDKFVDGLVRTVQKHLFVPELRPLVSGYSRLIQGKGKFSVASFGIETAPAAYTIDDAFSDLEAALTRIDRKVIVIIDDLDRLSFEIIKDVLFTIKKSFTLPNISYVLCYDTENIVSQGNADKDADKVREFLEKFVNVKFTIFLHAETLSKYVSENFDKAVQNNLQLDPYTLEKLKDVISALQEMYRSAEFHNYLPSIGDIRKVKRLINTLLLFEIEKTDFENSDFNKADLLHLLLIYINYPHIFRKIYNTETHGNRGFFSVVTPIDDSYPVTQDERSRVRGNHADSPYMNSSDYSAYVAPLSANARFLLDNVFSPSKRLDDATIRNVPQEVLNSYACFNGGSYGTGGRTLEQYLELIVKLSKPQRREQYRFYLNARDKLTTGKKVEEIFDEPEFAFSTSESTREQFWRVVVNSARDLNPIAATQVISYLTERITDYSLLEIKEIGVGSRDDFAYFLVKLLDSAGWSDAQGGHRDNSNDNLLEIAKWVFGEDRHANAGIVDRLGAADRGPLGLYDLLIFRLYCSADRGGDFFNLQRALIKHADPNASTDGVVMQLAIFEMREISQKVFGLFNTQYAVADRNIFGAIDELTLDDLTGKYAAFVRQERDAGRLSDDKLEHGIASLKSRMKAFITYQLGNSMTSSGVGCGYYDEVGNADQHGIAHAINQYLFGHCFNPAGDPNAFQCFLDYLLINFATTFDEVRRYIPHMDEFTKVLQRERLLAYWREHRAAIIQLRFETTEKRVVTGNYVASYREDLPDVYRLLDQAAEAGLDEHGQPEVLHAEVPH